MKTLRCPAFCLWVITMWVCEQIYVPTTWVLQPHTQSLCLPRVLLAGSLSTQISAAWKHNTDKSWQFYTWFQAAAFKWKCRETASSTMIVCRLRALCFQLAMDLLNIGCACLYLWSQCMWLTCHVTYGNHRLGKGLGGSRREKQKVYKTSKLTTYTGCNFYNTI